MDKPQKPRKFRLPSLLKGKKEAVESRPPAIGGAPPQEYGDRQRAVERYREAAQLLTQSIKASHGYEWGSFEFPDLSGEPEDFNDSQFRAKINEVLTSRRSTVKDQNAWDKCRQTALSVFSALSPFAKNFLKIAKDGQSIPVLNPYGLICGGLLLLITIAETEIARKAELDNALDRLYQQVGYLDIINHIPHDLEQLDSVIARAMDVRSASMLFLAVQIQHEKKSLGTRVVKVFFTGDDRITDSASYLKTAVDSFNTALNSFHLRVSLKALELLKGMTELKTPSPNNERESMEDKFIVPYEQNPHFTGRKIFLQSLREKLCESSNGYSHRVALYGMGGIGKTQVALEYVYTYRSYYDRVYWIRAEDRVSIMTGYQNIAKEARLPIAAGSTPSEIARRVLLWLRQEKKWLLVLDNLDDIAVIDNLLPENGLEQHTLISTRNPNSAGIPAEGVEVPLLDRSEAIAFLSTLSGIAISSRTSEESQAEEIVRELGYLPLAIEQAGAYVREVTGNFALYWEEYQRNHEVLHRWVPKGNRPYRDSVATTWSMTLKMIQSNHILAAKLLRILAYLNPDGILLDFIRDGAAGLDGDLQQMVANLSQMATALLELEKFSLIKWNRPRRILIIHRLVQTVVRDEVCDTEKISILNEVVELCRHAFPNKITNQTRSLCRLYRNQVTEPLRQGKAVCTTQRGYLLYSVGEFIRDEGSSRESEKYLKEAVEIFMQNLGLNSLNTLYALSSLAFVHLDSMKSAEGTELLEKVLAAQKTFLGEEHPATLSTTYALLAALYNQGRYTTIVKFLPDLIERQKSAQGENSPEALRTASLLVITYRELDRLAEAEALGELVLPELEVCEDGYTTVAMMNLLVTIYGRSGRMQEATNMAKRAVDVATKVLGKEHARTLNAIRFLAMSYADEGQTVKAINMVKEILSKEILVAEGETTATLDTVADLADLYWKQGEIANAEELYVRAYTQRERILGECHPHTLQSMDRLISTYRHLGRVTEADHLEEKLSFARQKLAEEPE